MQESLQRGILACEDGLVAYRSVFRPFSLLPQAMSALKEGVSSHQATVLAISILEVGVL